MKTKTDVASEMDPDIPESASLVVKGMSAPGDAMIWVCSFPSKNRTSVSDIGIPGSAGVDNSPALGFLPPLTSALDGYRGVGVFTKCLSVTAVSY